MRGIRSCYSVSVEGAGGPWVSTEGTTEADLAEALTLAARLSRDDDRSYVVRLVSGDEARIVATCTAGTVIYPKRPSPPVPR